MVILDDCIDILYQPIPTICFD